MDYPKHELIERLGEPSEEHTQPDVQHPGRLVNIMRWECGCAAAKDTDERLWRWDGSDCADHASGLVETVKNAPPVEPDF
jgi:hypothetical protein